MVRQHRLTRSLIKSAGGLAAAAALVGVLALTPAGSLAQSFLTIFQPKQFVAIPVTMSDLQSLPDLRQYGTMTRSQGGYNDQQVATVADAARVSGLTIVVPSSLPATVPATVTYAVMSQRTASFTFSAAKAAAAAAQTGKALPAMPSDLDGSTLNVTIGPVVAAIYGGSVGSSSSSVTTKDSRLDPQNYPSLVVAEAPVPTVGSTGATVASIENYLLAQPGVSPGLASAIKAIGDPTSTLPVPIPVNLASGQPVQVQGVTGLKIGDNTGLGSAIIWHKDGMVYGVAGLLSADQVLTIANGLH